MTIEISSKLQDLIEQLTKNKEEMKALKNQFIYANATHIKLKYDIALLKEDLKNKKVKK